MTELMPTATRDEDTSISPQLWHSGFGGVTGTPGLSLLFSSLFCPSDRGGWLGSARRLADSTWDVPRDYLADLSDRSDNCNAAAAASVSRALSENATATELPATIAPKSNAPTVRPMSKNAVNVPTSRPR